MFAQDVQSQRSQGAASVEQIGPKTLFSHPATLHLDVELFPGSRKLGREAADIRAFGLRYPAPIAGSVLGAAYAWRLW
ncbi:MAG: hypothetical protein ACRD36_02900, partial [Candidatus Acidiferrum sp.]